MRPLIVLALIAIAGSAHAAPAHGIDVRATLTSEGRGVVAWGVIPWAGLTCVARDGLPDEVCVVGGGEGYAELALPMQPGEQITVTAYAGQQAVAQGAAVAEARINLPLLRSQP